jgi:AcrR family transcriptional regulator
VFHQFDGGFEPSSCLNGLPLLEPERSQCAVHMKAGVCLSGLSRYFYRGCACRDTSDEALRKNREGPLAVGAQSSYIMTDESVIVFESEAMKERLAATPTDDAVSETRSARAERAAARRIAILEAALDEFSARGFAGARLDDVAQRAGVAKGTIYLHFKDKEALFQELVRTMLGPLIAGLEQLRASDLPIRTVLEHFAELFVREIYGTRRREVARLVITEGTRFPELAEFYYREVVARGIGAMRAMIERAVARGEVRHATLARFPQLVAAPGLMAILWAGLFDRFDHLDVAEMMRAHIDILLERRE